MEGQGWHAQARPQYDPHESQYVLRVLMFRFAYVDLICFLMIRFAYVESVRVYTSSVLV